MLVRDCMTPDPIHVSPKESLRGVQEVFAMRKIRHLPVMDNGKLVGFVSDRDLRRAAPSALSGSDIGIAEQILDGTTVDRVMVKMPMTVSSMQPLKDAVEIFVAKKFGAIPVVDAGKLVGIISQHDVLKLVLKGMK